MCDRIFSRKDIRSRHQAERHAGRRRPRTLAANVAEDSGSFEARTEGDANHAPINGDVSMNQRIVATVIPSMMIDLASSIMGEDLDSSGPDPVIEEMQYTDSSFNLLGLTSIAPIDSPLLLCTDLLIRCKPYKRFYIHDKKRELVSRKKWRDPHMSFLELYGRAIRALLASLAPNTKDPELLAAVATFVNVDVLINGALNMGWHAKAMYAMKAHHQARRDAIFDALEDAFEHCGKSCRSIRIIYTKHGFVWMLNVRRLCPRSLDIHELTVCSQTGYRCLRIPID